jgi:hypothetical protein
MPLSDLIGVLNQYRGASASEPPAGVQTDYSAVAPQVPQSDLADGLATAFRSDQTPPFGQMLGSLFGNSNGQQKAGILNQLLSAVGPGLLSSGALGGLAGLLRGGNTVTPEQANQIPPEAVTQLAEHAEKQNPSIVDQASQFYAQHPTLVQALGAGSLALIMSHLSRK